MLFITPIYTLFCIILSIGKTSMGYKTLFEQIKTVCAWNSLNDKQSENYDCNCNGHNGIIMRVCDQNIVSGLTLQPLPSLVYRPVNSRHVC